MKSYLDFHIEMVIDEGLPTQWRFVGFYGHPNANRRKNSWNLLRQISRRFDLPWVCVGDFNEIVSNAENSGGMDRPKWQIRDFREVVDECYLQDLGFKGCHFTWWNGCADTHEIRVRLDRIWTSPSWVSLFPNSSVEHVPTMDSDYCQVVFNTLASQQLGEGLR